MRVLFVTPRPPWPVRRGDQVRSARFAEGLAEHHEVSVLALLPPGFPEPTFPIGIRGKVVACNLRDQLASFWRVLSLPLQVAIHVIPALQRALRAELKIFRPDVVVLVVSRLGWLADDLQEVPAVIDLIDSLELNLRRRASREGLLRPLIAWEAARVGSWEKHLVRRLNAGIVISEQDMQAIAENEPSLRSRIHVIPNPVPLSAERPNTPTGEILITTGNLGYFPTVDGALWFAREVWPRIREQYPAAQWWLAGARPAAALARVADGESIILFEEPEDLGALRRQSTLAVVPLFSGSGTANKILEAMADGIPVVTTTLGQKGLDQLDLIDENVVMIADDPERFAEAVLRLLNDRDLARRQSMAATVWLRETHALPRVIRRMETLLASVARMETAGEAPERSDRSGATAF